MRQDWKFWLPALAAISGVMIAVGASYFGGFLGIAIAGLVITFAAVRYDLEKSDMGGGFPSPSLYARQIEVRAQMTPDERNAYRANLHALWRPLFIGRTIGIGLIILGIGGYLFL
ncbi:MAG: hypothetical protein E6G97_00965 [Alphaproteobacteria bacterium]|nr:MAG: hypothetical protein E6G97_00965 [Alphaproteobacteria bacterium]